MTNEISRRSILVRATAAAAVTALPIAGATALAEPAFAIIANHRAALEAAIETARKWGELLPSDPLYDHMGDLSAAAWDRADEALYLALIQRPTTLAGAVALLEHVSLPEFLGPPQDDEDRRTILSAELESHCKARHAAESFCQKLAAPMRDLIGNALGA